MDKETGHARILVLVVHYRSSGAILEMFHSFGWLNGNNDVELVVVDNASGSEELTKIRRAIVEFSNARLLESPTNHGYFGAARFAFDHYLEQGNTLPDWVIVCNHDILIEDKEFFSKLFCQDSRIAGIIAPRIEAMPGRVDQNPFMRERPSPLRWAQLRFVSSNYCVAAVWDWLWRQKSQLRAWLAARRSDSLLDGNAKCESISIYAAHGCFFIFSRRYFEAGGFLDGNLFLYGEEISVAEICRSLGLPVVYEPSLCVVHKEHQSTGKVLSRFTYECQKRAMQYVTSRYLSRSPGPASSCQPDLS
jgi:GT2 family glycosyltransferase